MVDREAFRSLSYGLYIVSSKLDGTSMGCVVNTFAQVTSEPAQVSVAVLRQQGPLRLLPWTNLPLWSSLGRLVFIQAQILTSSHHVPMQRLNRVCHM